MNTTPARRQRVPALSPDERRATLIKATIPLLLEWGGSLTTRQIADAAGVAEGTIFGVFPDKASLIRAAVIEAMNPGPLLAALGQIPRDADLRTRMVAAVDVMRNRIAVVAPLMHVIRANVIRGDVAWPPPELADARQEMMMAVATVIEPDRHLLRFPPQDIARLLQSMVMTGSRGFLGEGEIFDSRELVSLLLDGLLVRADSALGEARADTTPA